MDTSEIIRIFSYTEDEQKNVSYISDYMKKSSSEFERFAQTEDGKLRFMLAGPFLTYRACNHIGVSMSTRIAGELSGEHSERLKAFEAISGKSIVDTSHYLRLIGLTPVKMMMPFRNHGRFLSKFLKSSEPLQWQG